MVKISIIIPTYNVENYLVECLDSVINQTLKEIEIIIVNDGSKDSSLEIAKQYACKDNRIIIIDKQNEGYGKAVNVGFEAATGEYIGIVEPDDFIELNMYEVLYSKTKIKKFDIVKGSYYYYHNSKHFYYDDYIYNVIKEEKEVNVLDWDMQDLWLVHASIWSAIYKREFLINKNIKLLETPGASYQDLAFIFETFFSAESTYFTPDCLYYYRTTNPNSSSHLKNNKILYLVFDTLLLTTKRLKQTNEEKYNKYIYLFDCRYIQFIIWHITKAPSEGKFAYIDYCKNYIEKNQLGKYITTIGKLEWTQEFLFFKNLEKFSTVEKLKAVYHEERKIRKFYDLKFALKNLIVIPSELVWSSLKLLILNLKI